MTTSLCLGVVYYFPQWHRPCDYKAFVLISCFYTHVKLAIILCYKRQNINFNLYVLSFCMITANLLVMCLFTQTLVLPHFCTSTISILLDTDDRSLIAYMGDVHDKEEPTIKNMSGSSNAML